MSDLERAQEWLGCEPDAAEDKSLGYTCREHGDPGVADWPCSTVRLVAEHYGIDMPDEWAWVWADALREARGTEQP